MVINEIYLPNVCTICYLYFATSTNTQQLGTATLKNPGVPTTEEDPSTRLAKADEARKNRKF